LKSRRNSIALEKITDVKNLVAPEKMPYAQSDWNSAERPEFTNVLYQLKYTNSLNSVSALIWSSLKRVAL
jgi:hypothetical protein